MPWAVIRPRPRWGWGWGWGWGIRPARWPTRAVRAATDPLEARRTGLGPQQGASGRLKDSRNEERPPQDSGGLPIAPAIDIRDEWRQDRIDLGRFRLIAWPIDS